MSASHAVSTSGEAIVIREWQESGKGFFQREIELEALHGKDS